MPTLCFGMSKSPASVCVPSTRRGGTEAVEITTEVLLREGSLGCNPQVGKVRHTREHWGTSGTRDPLWSWRNPLKFPTPICFPTRTGQHHWEIPDFTRTGTVVQLSLSPSARGLVSPRRPARNRMMPWSFPAHFMPPSGATKGPQEAGPHSQSVPALWNRVLGLTSC